MNETKKLSPARHYPNGTAKPGNCNPVDVRCGILGPANNGTAVFPGSRRNYASGAVRDASVLGLRRRTAFAKAVPGQV